MASIAQSSESSEKTPIHRDEVAKHNSSEDCWVVLNGHAYDMSDFLEDHPGGAGIIMKYAGRDASKAFNPIHPKNIVDTLPPSAHLGPVTPAEAPVEAKKDDSDDEDEGEIEEIPDISQMVNVWDFETVAKKNVTKEAWAYLMSGADDEISFRENHAAFHRVMLKPRVLVDVDNIDMTSTVLGTKMSIPLYVTSCALGRLYHEDGECCLTRGAALAGIPQLCPTLASCTMDEMHAARSPGQTQWWQLYVNKDRELTKTVVQKAENLGFKALFITVDAPQLGRRERDMRNKAKMSANVQTKQKDKIPTQQGTTRAISSFIDPSLSWKDMPWFKSITNMPIILKGIQTGEDVVRAYEAGMDGCVVSNHGGRQLDYARSGIEMLVEIMDALHSIGADMDKFTVLVDGGFRRGSDLFKALALGAKAVGIGRPTLVGMAAYGEEGVEKVVQIFKDEMEMHMRLMGTPTIADMTRDLVITRNVADHFSPAPTDFLSQQVYEPLPLATRVSKL
jgi:L-lactate dehydrogenase (cytochrome)|mmetsp:Transcript_91885/g.145304  ORF Transcript_91885/g.145304 Transcript_91885/m.145304 type:complete len:506 (+) Transcript_91885:55-1572(+)